MIGAFKEKTLKSYQKILEKDGHCLVTHEYIRETIVIHFIENNNIFANSFSDYELYNYLSGVAWMYYITIIKHFENSDDYGVERGKDLNLGVTEIWEKE